MKPPLTRRGTIRTALALCIMLAAVAKAGSLFRWSTVRLAWSISSSCSDASAEGAAIMASANVAAPATFVSMFMGPLPHGISRVVYALPRDAKQMLSVVLGSGGIGAASRYRTGTRAAALAIKLETFTHLPFLDEGNSHPHMMDVRGSTR